MKRRGMCKKRGLAMQSPAQEEEEGQEIVKEGESYFPS